MGGERLKRRSISSGRFVLNSLVLANGPALAPVDRNRDFARDRRAAQRPALEPEIGGRAVLGRLIVPDSDVAFAPAPAHDVLGLGDMILQRLEQPRARSEERRVGKECVSTFRFRWAPKP